MQYLYYHIIKKKCDCGRMRFKFSKGLVIDLPYSIGWMFFTETNDSFKEKFFRVHTGEGMLLKK
ncbi:MAG: hypothetical protein EA344_02020 [Alkalicoccus sp.]|nr:MAG: hypothetical protein EA344_02020 [Alkalicoccus sp.]